MAAFRLINCSEFGRETSKVDGDSKAGHPSIRLCVLLSMLEGQEILAGEKREVILTYRLNRPEGPPE